MKTSDKNYSNVDWNPLLFLKKYSKADLICNDSYKNKEIFAK